ncbi:ACP phosphodiesterase [Pedobacter sp. GR22-6]|uniref:ACP phosphodiesterase n=1 Tax=Pedobacter sp. GR22-6 TaxID=3127957 RepID=UPI00307E72D5
MNFLSHFYFDRYNDNENIVMGIVLPDFIKNAQKDCNLYPLKEAHLFANDPSELSILSGWARHIQVDNIFHSSEFFKTQSHELKLILLPIFGESPVKPFFLAHIGLELILDHLLTIEGIININSFYEQLQKADKAALESFLKQAGMEDTSLFFKFLESFLSSKYLLSYQKIENISYALKRICMRLWDNPFTEEQVQLLTDKLILFRDQLKPHYMSIFQEIDLSLNPLQA